MDAFTAEQREHAIAKYQEEHEKSGDVGGSGGGSDGGETSSTSYKTKRRGIWICKPSDLSRGRKIFLLRSLKDLSYDC